jgi:hypothetical protein
MKQKKTGRVIEVTPEDNILFQRMLLDLYDRGIFKNPKEFASELFQLGLHLKRRNLLNGEIHHEQ